MHRDDSEFCPCPSGVFRLDPAAEAGHYCVGRLGRVSEEPSPNPGGGRGGTLGAASWKMLLVSERENGIHI